MLRILSDKTRMFLCVCSSGNEHIFSRVESILLQFAARIQKARNVKLGQGLHDFLNHCWRTVFLLLFEECMFCLFHFMFLLHRFCCALCLLSIFVGFATPNFSNINSPLLASNRQWHFALRLSREIFSCLRSSKML